MTPEMPSPTSSLDLSFLRRPGAARRCAAVALACLALGAAYAFLAPKWYRSVLTVMPVKPQKSGISGLLGGQLGGLAASLDPGGAAADVARIAAVLQSVSVTDAVIERFDLRKRYRQDYIETTRDKLWSHCDVKALTKPNLVQLSCEDKDPRFVQEMLSFFADHGNQVFRRVSVSSASEEARSLEKRVAELRQQADATSERMREFQEKHQIVDIETQSKAVVSALASLNAQRIRKELELGYARTFTSSEEATTRQLSSELALVEQKLRDMERPPDPGAAPQAGQGRRSKEGTGVFPYALAVPKLRAEFEGLYRDRKVAEATLVFALEHLEAAKASEARDVSTFVILDPPALPTRHARPRRSIVVLISLLVGIVAGIGLEWTRSVGGLAAAARRLGANPQAR